MSSHIGEQFGEYCLDQKLGGGSYGDVYLGKHTRNNTGAAVKLLQVRLNHKEDLTDFINEVRILFRLQHPHIVPLLDFGIEQDIPFLIMAYAPNGTLRQSKGTRLPLDTIAIYIKHIAEALQYAHEHKLIHRDVKPDNILLGPASQIWLSDFGIASIAHSTRSLNTLQGIGTIPYMAPEQIQGKPRPASDQYALGIIAYEWICGSRPFTGTAIEITVQHVQATPRSLCEQVPTLPSGVEQVVLKSLKKEPQERFGSILEFAEALALTVSRSRAPASVKRLYSIPKHDSELKVKVWEDESVPIPKPDVPENKRVPSRFSIPTLEMYNAMAAIYNSIREGRILDIQVILDLADRFEAIANDPQASQLFPYDEGRAASNLRKRAVFLKMNDMGAS